MLDVFLGLDPTVQVALIGAVSAVVVSVWAVIRAYLQPKDKEKEVVYGPKEKAVSLSEADQLRVDRAIFVLDSLVDTIERLRVEISLIDRK